MIVVVLVVMVVMVVAVLVFVGVKGIGTWGTDQATLPLSSPESIVLFAFF